MSSLNETLTMLAAQLHCDAQQLIEFANEDHLGGYHWNPALATFKQGSCFGVEGQTLYAIIRLLKPEKVVEVGGWAGCSGAHMASAVIKNGVGHVYSIDNEVGGQQHGADMPREFQDVVTLVRANGQDWLAEQPDASIDFMFEDADHSTALVALLTGLALKKIAPGGVLANHDAAHDQAIVGGGQVIGSDVGRAVRDGLAQAGAYFSVYLAEPSDCGLAITVIPGTRKERTTVWGRGEFPSKPIASDHIAALSQVGNANIESDGLLKPFAPATEEDTKPTPVKKPAPRGKGKRVAK